MSEIRPFRTINRRKSRQINVGKVLVGGDAPISVQSMTNTLTTDIKGTITHPGVAYKMFNALSSKNINIQVISTSEIKISVLVDEKNTKEAVQVIHQVFELDK